MVLEINTSGSGKMVSDKGMEYTVRQVGQSIRDSRNRIIKMVKHIIGGQMEMNIGESGRATSNGEREYKKRKENYTELHMEKVI